MSKRPIFVLLSIAVLLVVVTAAAATDANIIVQRREHVVQRGQVAVNIAKQYGTSIEELRKLNAGRDLRRLHTGDRLVIEEKRIDAPQQKPKPSSSVVEQNPLTPTLSRERRGSKAATSSDHYSDKGRGSVDASSDRPDKVAMLAKLDEQPKQDVNRGAGSIGSALSMILKLGIVLLLAYLSILALKLLSAKRDVLPNARSEMKVVDTVRLSSTGSVHLVEVRGRSLLLGCSTTGQVTLLQEFVADQAEQPDGEMGVETPFARYLAAYSGRSGQNSPAMRVAGLLRDCASHLRNRRANGSGRNFGDDHGA